MTDWITKVESGFPVRLPVDVAVDADDWLGGLARFGVKSVDFIRLAAGCLELIEFKSTMPRPDGKATDAGLLRERCREVVEKAERTAEVILALSAGRSLEPSVRLPAWLIAHGTAGPWQVVLVVTQARPEWLEAVRNVLREALRPLARSIGLQVEPKVLDEGMARRWGLAG